MYMGIGFPIYLYTLLMRFMKRKSEVVKKMNSEDWEQKQLIQWARSMPELQYLFHIPNETVGGKGWLIRNRQLGVRSGVPDLMLPIPCGGFHGLFIEMKAEKGRVSHTQELWLRALNQLGYKAVVCRGWKEARDVICEYLGKNPTMISD